MESDSAIKRAGVSLRIGKYVTIIRLAASAGRRRFAVNCAPAALHGGASRSDSTGATQSDITLSLAYSMRIGRDVDPASSPLRFNRPFSRQVYQTTVPLTKADVLADFTAYQQVPLYAKPNEPFAPGSYRVTRIAQFHLGGKHAAVNRMLNVHPRLKTRLISVRRVYACKSTRTKITRDGTVADLLVGDVQARNFRRQIET